MSKIFWVSVLIFVFYTLLGIAVYSMAVNERGELSFFGDVGKWKRPVRVMFNLSFEYFWPAYLAVGFTIGAISLLLETVRSIFK
jgi:hypothetical protein